MTGLSQKRSFIGGAISTAASPLRNAFEISCRSPATPRRTPRPSNRDDGPSEKSLSLISRTDATRYSTYNSSQFLSTPRHYAIKSPTNNHRSHVRSIHNGDFSPTAILESSTLTPAFTPPPISGTLSTFSAITLILGKTVGVSIYALPSSILSSVGSVGASLTLWVIGSLISFCGLSVYLTLGCAHPRSGGERVYLERIFKRPRMLATCMFGAYVVLLGFSTPNCIVLGEYVMFALEIEANRWNIRTIAVAIITLICLIHARYQSLGLRIINVLGVGKMVIIAIVILSGIAGALMGVGSSSSSSPISRRRLMDGTWSIDSQFLDQGLSTAQRNFGNVWEGSSRQPYDYATALLKILYCFRGYSAANQVLSEVRNPVPTLKRAAPVALSLISIGYILANVAYFLVVEKEDFKNAGVVVAGHFFKNVFGEVMGENVLPLLVIVSAFGNIAATSFAQARVNQELGRDGLLPFSRFFARKSGFEKEKGSGEPPVPGLFLHWLVSVLVILVPPPGDIYNFLVDIGGYPVSVMSVAIALGLLYLQSDPKENWESPFKGRKIYTLVFAASNVLLLVLPWIKPKEDNGDGRFPYYAYPATALGILGLGVAYWIWWSKIKPHHLLKSRGEVGREERGVGEERMLMTRFEGVAEGGDDDVEGYGDREKKMWKTQGLGEGIPEAVEKQAMRKRAPCGCPTIH